VPGEAGGVDAVAEAVPGESAGIEGVAGVEGAGMAAASATASSFLAARPKRNANWRVNTAPKKKICAE